MRLKISNHRWEQERTFFVLLLAGSMMIPYSFAGSVSLMQPWHFLFWVTVSILFALGVDMMVPVGLPLKVKAVLITVLWLGGVTLFTLLN